MTKLAKFAKEVFGSPEASARTSKEAYMAECAYNQREAARKAAARNATTPARTGRMRSAGADDLPSDAELEAARKEMLDAVDGEVVYEPKINLDDALNESDTDDELSLAERIRRASEAKKASLAAEAAARQSADEEIPEKEESSPEKATPAKATAPADEVAPTQEITAKEEAAIAEETVSEQSSEEAAPDDPATIQDDETDADFGYEQDAYGPAIEILAEIPEGLAEEQHCLDAVEPMPISEAIQFVEDALDVDYDEAYQYLVDERAIHAFWYWTDTVETDPDFFMDGSSNYQEVGSIARVQPNLGDLIVDTFTAMDADAKAEEFIAIWKKNIPDEVRRQIIRDTIMKPYPNYTDDFAKFGETDKMSGMEIYKEQQHILQIQRCYEDIMQQRPGNGFTTLFDLWANHIPAQVRDVVVQMAQIHGVTGGPSLARELRHDIQALIRALRISSMTGDRGPLYAAYEDAMPFEVKQILLKKAGLNVTATRLKCTPIKEAAKAVPTAKTAATAPKASEKPATEAERSKDPKPIMTSKAVLDGMPKPEASEKPTTEAAKPAAPKPQVSKKPTMEAVQTAETAATAPKVSEKPAATAPKVSEKPATEAEKVATKAANSTQPLASSHRRRGMASGRPSHR